MKTGKLRQLDVERGREISASENLPGREFHELWFALAKHPWRSVVIVPADEGASAVPAAAALASVGKQLHQLPVTLFAMEAPADYLPAVQIIDKVRAEERMTRAPSPGSALDYASAVHFVAVAASPPSDRAQEMGKVIVAIQPVIAEPLGLAVTQAADLVVLYVKRGSTRLASVRRTIELVGRERIGGCFLDCSRDRPNDRRRGAAR